MSLDYLNFCQTGYRIHTNKGCVYFPGETLQGELTITNHEVPSGDGDNGNGSGGGGDNGGGGGNSKRHIGAADIVWSQSALLACVPDSVTSISCFRRWRGKTVQA